jgi:diguanylate cyclase (GGDEF)-like protein
MRFIYWYVLLFLLLSGIVAALASNLEKSRFQLEDFITAQDRKFLDRIQTIRKCVDPLWMPLEGINDTNQHVGVIADITELVEQRIGVPIVLVPTASWVESMEKLKSRECDLVTSHTLQGETTDYYVKTVPFMEHRNVYITRDNEPLQLDFSVITDKPIGISEGYPTIPLIEERYGNVNFVPVKNIDEGILKVSKGELYAFTDLLPICSYSIQKQGMTNLKVAGHIDIAFPVVMAVRSDMPDLVRILNKAFVRMDSATVNQFLTRWVKIEYDMRWDWSRLSIYIMAGCVFVLIVLYWNRRLYTLYRELDKANSELALINETDTLTRLKNRNFIDNQLPGIVKLAGRNRLPMGVALLDMDHFKRLNDRYGHGVGDKCLVAFADEVRSCFQRESDFAIRYGGEEFVIICIGMSQKNFARRLEKLRKAVEGLRIKTSTADVVRVTVSAGFVYFPEAPEAWTEDLIDKADDFLYEAKTLGRNCTRGNLYSDLQTLARQ